MSILIDQSSRIIIQGITGREARMVAGHMVEYGSPLVAGVTPGRGGQDVAGVPVYDTVADAVAIHQANTSLVSVPPAATLDACREAIANGIQLIVIATEGMPQHDALQLLEIATCHNTTIVGPNSVGVISPAARSKIGAIGGDNAGRAFVPGRVGVISRSGGMTSEMSLLLRQAGYGVSTAVSVGGDALIGSPPSKLLAHYQADTETDAVLLFGEPGTRFEEEAAEQVASGAFTKPLIAMVAGQFTEELPEGTAFGHAAAIIEGSSGRPSEKLRRIQEAGGYPVLRLDEIPPLLARVIGSA